MKEREIMQILQCIYVKFGKTKLQERLSIVSDVSVLKKIQILPFIMFVIWSDTFDLFNSA